MEQSKLIGRVRDALAGHSDLREVKMFGGLCFMLNGHMAAGVSPRGLLVRVGRENHAEAVSRQGAQVMEMRGRAMPGYVIVDLGSLDDRSVRAWVALARAHIGTLPRKTFGATPKRRKKD